MKVAESAFYLEAVPANCIAMCAARNEHHIVSSCGHPSAEIAPHRTPPPCPPPACRTLHEQDVCLGLDARHPPLTDAAPTAPRSSVSPPGSSPAVGTSKQTPRRNPCSRTRPPSARVGCRHP